MKTVKTPAKQRGFFGIGIALVLSAIFGATSATIVTLENDGKQETAAAQQKKEVTQPQANAETSSVPERSVTAKVE